MIRCGACGESLTEELELMAPGFVAEFDEGEEVAQRGSLIEHMVSIFRGPEPVFIVHPDSTRNLVRDRTAGSGCCGNSSDVATHRCQGCGALIATRIDDCYTAHYTYFRSALVRGPVGLTDSVDDPYNVTRWLGAATVYVNDSGVIVLARSALEDHRWFEDAWLMAEADPPHVLIGRRCLEALERSRHGVERPTSPGPLDELFGGWSEALRARRTSARVDVIRTSDAVHVVPVSFDRRTGYRERHELAESLAETVDAERLGDAIVAAWCALG